VIGYRVRFGVALAGGDPVGAAESAPAAVAAFIELCTRRGWRPAVLGSASADGAMWRRAGVRRAIEIGDEAVLPVAAFSLAGRPMRNLRQAVTRARRAGVRVRFGSSEVAELAPILREWLRGRGERGFAMNLDGLLLPRAGTVLAVARDAAGEPQAFARFAIAGGDRVLSLDVAPRRREAPNGVVEAMVVEAIAWAAERGIAEVSLNFAGMRRVYAGRSLAARVTQIPLRVLDRWIELRSLWRFTGKFHPVWRARELRMRSWFDLVQVGAAALTSEFGARPAPAAEPSGGEELVALRELG
jgi:lysyl-tRNA synthetase class 2